MARTTRYLPLLLIMLVSILLTACPQRVHERIKEGTRIGALDEAIHARDRALKSQVEGNIRSDLILRYYAIQYGLTVEVSHAVVTVSMKVKTEEQRDRALELAGQDDTIQEVVDNIDVDPTIEDPPFEW